MPDYKVTVGLETTGIQQADAGMRRAAGGVEQIDGAARSATTSVKRLEAAGTELSRVQQRLVVEQRKLAEATRIVDRMNERGSQNSRQYTRALDQQLAAQTRLARAITEADRVQQRAGGGGGVAAVPIGSRAGAKLAGVVGGIAVGTKIGQVGRDSIEEASALAQAVKTNQALFGDYARDVERLGGTSAKALGMSKVEVNEAAAGFGVLFNNLKLSQAESSKMATGTTTLAANLAALKNTGAPEALEAIRGGFVGEYDALQKFGINIDEANVKRAALSAGLISTTRDALTPAAKAQAVYAILLEQGASATGTLSKRSGDLAIQQKQAAAQIADAKAELGEGLVPAMTAAAQIANVALIPALRELGKAIGFIGEHESTRAIAGLLLGFVAVKHGLDAVRGASRLLLGDNAATVLSNRTVAASYDAVAGSASRAAIAQGAAGGAGAGAVGKTGLLQRLGGIAGLARGGVAVVGAAAGGAAIVGGFQVDEPRRLFEGAGERGTRHSDNFGFFGRGRWDAYKQQTAHLTANSLSAIGLGSLGDAIDRGSGYSYDVAAARRAERRRRDQAAAQAEADRRYQESLYGQPYRQRTAALEGARTREGTAGYNVRKARAYLDSRSYVADAASQPVRALLAALPEQVDPDVVAGARERLQDARDAVADKAADLRKARQGTAGATRSQLANAEAAILAAQRNIRRPGGDPTAEALKLEAAEARLAELREKGGRSADGLRKAERDLADSRRGVLSAQKDLEKAEKDASGDKSIALSEIITRSAKNSGMATGQAQAARALVAKGITQPVLAELLQLELEAPGTMANAVKGLTPALVKQLNADKAAREKAMLDLAKLGGQATLNEATAAAKAAGSAVGKAYTDWFLAALKDPHWRREIESNLGSLLFPGGLGNKPGEPLKPGAQTPTDVGGYLGGLTGLTPGVAAGATPPPRAPVVLQPAQAGPGKAWSRTTQYHFHGNVVANDPAQLHREIENRQRIAALGGGA
ncbi:MAG: hypothetical protein JWP11_3414 [Frankiales bacterium]|nr:hypothetical protein [Frankiales bacterium]